MDNPNLYITTQDDLDIFFSRICNAAINQQKKVNIEEAYKTHLGIMIKTSLLDSNQLIYFQKPESFFDIFCGVIFLHFSNDFTEDLIKMFSIKLLSKSATIIWKKFESSLYRYLLLKKYNNQTPHMNLLQTLNYFISYYGGNIEALYDALFRNFFFYNNQLTYCYDSNFYLADSKAISHFLQLQGYKFYIEEFNEELFHILSNIKSNQQFFHYSPGSDSKILYSNDYNNSFYEYEFNKIEQTFVQTASITPYKRSIILTYTNFFNKEDSFFIYSLTNGDRDIFNSISILLADIFCPKQIKNQFHIIIVKPSKINLITKLFQALSNDISQYEDLTQFLSIGGDKYFQQQYHGKRAVLIKRLTSINNKQHIKKLNYLLSNHSIKKKVLLDGKKKNIYYKNNLAIIGITDEIDMNNVYSKYNTNIIDLTHLESLFNLSPLNSLINWVLVPWVLHGMSIRYKKSNMNSNNINQSLRESSMCDFAKKYITVHEFDSDKEAKKMDCFCFGNDIYKNFKTYYNALHHSNDECFDKNTVTSLIKKIYKTNNSVRYSRKRDENQLNSYGFSGITIDSEKLDRDILLINSTYQKEIERINNHKGPKESFEGFKTFLTDCEKLIPSELKKIVLPSNTLRAVLTNVDTNRL